MRNSERLTVLLPGGELEEAVLQRVQQSGLELTAVDRRYLHRGR